MLALGCIFIVGAVYMFFCLYTYHMLTAGCDFSAVDIEQKTALHWAAGNRDAACVQALLDTYPPLLNRQ